jgi:TetR/AcrR family transcriptional regulator
MSSKKEETVKRILDVAAEAFAETGFSGARIDGIAEGAQVNKATIYYHIGNKAALYARVIHDVIGYTAEEIAVRVAEAETPEEKLKMYTRILLETIDRQPHLPSIMMREMASGGRHLPESAVKDFLKMFRILTEILELGVSENVFARTVPLLVHFMAAGMMLFFKKVTALKDRFADTQEISSLLPYMSLNPIDEIETLVLRSVRQSQ